MLKKLKNKKNSFNCTLLIANGMRKRRRLAYSAISKVCDTSEILMRVVK